MLTNRDVMIGVELVPIASNTSSMDAMSTRVDALPKIQPPATAEQAMKNRSVKCDDPTWDAAAARAKADGLNLSEVVRHYLREYAAS